MRFLGRADLPSNFDGLEVMRVEIEPAALGFMPEPIECKPELNVRLDRAVASLDVLLQAILSDVQRTFSVVTGELDPTTSRPLLGEAEEEQSVEPDNTGFVPVKDVKITHQGPL